MNIPSLQWEEAAVLPHARIIDVRSPSEYEQDHRPGAENVPLFEDDQRKVVGALYKNESPEKAMEQGLAMVEGRLLSILRGILGEEADLSLAWSCFAEVSTRVGHLKQVSSRGDAPSLGEGVRPILVHCWRGGMRSSSVVALLRALGFSQVFHVEGGYRSYRRTVRETLSGAGLIPEVLIVLDGPTGVGKTRVLRALESREPGTTLDLEGLAQHRSSFLGAVGLSPVTQKYFDSRLAMRLPQLRPGPIFVEGESRKVGSVVLPGELFGRMQRSPRVEVSAGMAHRLRVLGEEYLASPKHQADLRSELHHFEKHMGRQRIRDFQADLDRGGWRQVAKALLMHHYDHLYGGVADPSRRCLSLKVDELSEAEILDSLSSLRHSMMQTIG